MAVIAPEQFITAITAEGHGEATAASLAAHQMGGQLGGIGEGFGIQPRQGRDQSAGIGGGEGNLAVMRAEVGSYGPGKRRLVEAAFATAGIGEGDGEASHRPAALGLEQGGDQRGVDAAGEKGAKGHIGDRLFGHGLLQGIFEGL